MLGFPSDFWAKLQRDASGGVVAWHPLAAHCADVASVAEALLTRTLLGARLARLAGRERLDEITIARLGWCAALHDLGKLNHGFQAKALPLDAPVDRRGHVVEALALFHPVGRDRDLVALQARLPLAAIAAWGPDDVGFHLLVAAIGHHGRPGNLDAAHVERALWAPRGGRDPGAGLAALVEAATRWFPAAFASDAPALPVAPEFQHAFAGLVMLADWIGSDASQDAFPYQREDDPPDRMTFARGRAARVLRRLGLDVADARDALGPRAPAFSEVWGFAPRAGQEAILALDPRPAEGTLTLLESETGSGKTEAALAHFLRLFHAGCVDGLYFALPTRTAATQLHERVTKSVARAFSDAATRPAVVLAVPGYLRVDDADGRKLAPFEVLWNDDRLRAERHRGWAAEQPKRFLAGGIVVGTIDQALLSTLQVDHAHLRATALSRHLLVVDEVHASDAYGTRLLEEVLGAQLAAGGHALLLSATLGTAARTRLFTPHDAPRRPPPPLAEAVHAPYPALTTRAARASHPEVRAITGPGRERRIACTVSPQIDEPGAIVDDALDAARRGARVLVIRNTVSGCLATQRALEERCAPGEASLLFTVAGVPAPHHARFARDDRAALDEALAGAFGRDAPRVGGCVAIATQTVQQSLDLDADLLLTDLCPMDVLLQRLGRLHRHAGRARPPGFEAARAVVIVPERRELGALIDARGEARGAHGFGTVYEDLRVLEATWRLLEATPALVIPAMNRALVERTTHPEALSAIVAEMGGAWGPHQQHIGGGILAARGVALANLMRRDVPIGEVDACFPEKTTERRITTRLGEGDRELTFAEPFTGPFGRLVGRLLVPAWLSEGIASDGVASVRLMGDATVVLSGAASFVYDRHGLRKGDTV
jgi:CRISPR-associated endonuclease/helicase Cas3